MGPCEYFLSVRGGSATNRIVLVDWSPRGSKRFSTRLLAGSFAQPHVLQGMSEASTLLHVRHTMVWHIYVVFVCATKHPNPQAWSVLFSGLDDECFWRTTWATLKSVLERGVVKRGNPIKTTQSVPCNISHIPKCRVGDLFPTIHQPPVSRALHGITRTGQSARGAGLAGVAGREGLTVPNRYTGGHPTLGDSRHLPGHVWDMFSRRCFPWLAGSCGGWGIFLFYTACTLYNMHISAEMVIGDTFMWAWFVQVPVGKSSH